MAIVALVPETKGAVILVGNAGAQTSATGVPGAPTHVGAAGFLSPNVATEITSVTATFATGSTAGEFPTLVMGLYADASGVPGSLLAGLGSATMTTSSGNEVMTFAPGSAVALAASTSYFLGVTCPACISGTRQSNWAMSSTASLVGLAGSNVTAGVFFSNNSGASYSHVVTNATLIFRLDGNETVNGAVPEPASITLLAGGLGVMVWFRRRAW